MPQEIVDLLNKGAQANKADKFRHGNVIHLPGRGKLVVTGDIHGHRRNFERVCAFADLDNNPDTHIILQEIIHGGPEDAEGGCLSYKLLFDVVLYKLTFPDRVHIIMGNHDTAFITDSRVMKSGKEMNHPMRQAVEHEFGVAGDDIKLSIKQLLFSQPIAVRCENRIWLSHSLPDNHYVDEFDQEILHRQLKTDDLVRQGSVYLLTWGRKHSQNMLDKLAMLFDVDIFVLGHQPQKQGYARTAENLIIITSEHNHGCLLPIELEKSYTTEELIDSIVPLASIS